MEIIALLIGGAVGVGAAFISKNKKEKEKEQKENTDYENIKNQNTNTFFSNKLEHEKDVMDIIKEIVYADELKNFKIVEKYKEKSKFAYNRNGFLFELTVSNAMIKCIVKNIKENQDLIKFDYDVYWSEFTDKKILVSVINGYQEEEAAMVLEDFMRKVTEETNWNLIGLDLTIVDDLKKVEETKKENPVALTAIRKIDELSYKVGNLIKDEELAKLFIETLEKLRQSNEVIEDSEFVIPIETKQKYQEVIIADIERLMNNYAFINAEDQEEFKGQIVEIMERIKRESGEIIEMLKEQKVDDLKVLLNTINKRY